MQNCSHRHVASTCLYPGFIGRSAGATPRSRDGSRCAGRNFSAGLVVRAPTPAFRQSPARPHSGKRGICSRPCRTRRSRSRHGDDLTAWQSVEGDHRRQILLERLVVFGQARRTDERGHHKRSGHQPSECVHDVFPVHPSRVEKVFGSARSFQIASREDTILDASF